MCITKCIVLFFATLFLNLQADRSDWNSCWTRADRQEIDECIYVYLFYIHTMWGPQDS